MEQKSKTWVTEDDIKSGEGDSLSYAERILPVVASYSYSWGGGGRIQKPNFLGEKNDQHLQLFGCAPIYKLQDS